MPVSYRTVGTVAARPARHAVAAILHDTAVLSASTRTGSGTTASVARPCMARVPTARAGHCFLEGGAPQPGRLTAVCPVQPWTRPQPPPRVPQHLPLWQPLMPMDSEPQTAPILLATLSSRTLETGIWLLEQVAVGSSARNEVTAGSNQAVPPSLLGTCRVPMEELMCHSLHIGSDQSASSMAFLVCSFPSWSWLSQPRLSADHQLPPSPCISRLRMCPPGWQLLTHTLSPTPSTVFTGQRAEDWQQTETPPPSTSEQLLKPHVHPQQVTLIDFTGTWVDKKQYSGLPPQPSCSDLLRCSEITG
jgi:hypothetical protein